MIRVVKVNRRFGATNYPIHSSQMLAQYIDVRPDRYITFRRNTFLKDWLRPFKDVVERFTAGFFNHPEAFRVIAVFGHQATIFNHLDQPV